MIKWGFAPVSEAQGARVPPRFEAGAFLVSSPWPIGCGPADAFFLTAELGGREVFGPQIRLCLTKRFTSGTSLRFKVIHLRINFDNEPSFVMGEKHRRCVVVPGVGVNNSCAACGLLLQHFMAAN